MVAAIRRQPSKRSPPASPEQLAVDSFALVDTHPDVGPEKQQQYEWKMGWRLGEAIALEASLRQHIGPSWTRLDHSKMLVEIEQALVTLQQVRRKMHDQTA